jgi:hypothetical protein
MFENKTGKQLAEAGLSLALQTADNEFPGWSDRCYRLFLRWINKKPKGFEFLMESFRTDCYKYNMIEKPRNLRSFGMVSKRAQKQGLIECIGTGQVVNPTAHNANAAKWRKI